MQTNFGTVSRAAFGKLLGDGVERKWGFPSEFIPSWTELNWMHGEFGLLPRGKRAATVGRYPGFFFFLCAVCSGFRNPPNADMDYRILNVRTWSCVCVRIHRAIGQHWLRLSTDILTRKSCQNFVYCAADGVQSYDLWFSSRCSTKWATP